MAVSAVLATLRLHSLVLRVDLVVQAKHSSLTQVGHPFFEVKSNSSPRLFFTEQPVCLTRHNSSVKSYATTAVLKELNHCSIVGPCLPY